MKWLVVAIAACTPAKHPSWAPKNNAAPTAAHRGEHPLHFGEHCNESEPVDIAGDVVTIVACFEPTEGEDLSASAYFVRRSTPALGTSQLLGAWTQHRETGEYYVIAGATRDRVIVHHQIGGLDDPGLVELRIYDPMRDAFTGQVIRGTDIKVVVAPGRASATAFVCEPARGQVYDMTKACSEQTGVQTKVIAID